jgi:undecaprenyl-diphosphatase
MNRFLKKIDVSLLNWIERHARTKRMDRVMLLASRLGDWGVIWIAYALLFMCAADKRSNARTLFLAVSVCALVGNFVIKPLFRRTRPCNIDGSKTLLLQRPSDSSFPSCHTMTSFAAVVAISQAGGILGATSLVFAGMISFSRMYLFMHYPSDVLIGAIMGLAAGKLFV